MKKRSNQAKPLNKTSTNALKKTKQFFKNETTPHTNPLKQNNSPKHTNSTLFKHYASTTELIYSPFQKQVYLPPHLNSTSIIRNIFKAECSNWSVRRSIQKYDYDKLYQINEQRYEKANSSNKWKKAKSKIKHLLDQDRISFAYFQKKKQLKCCPKRQQHPDDDLSEESSQFSQKQ